MKHLRISLAAVVALLLTAGCGSLGDVLGGGNNNPNTTNQTAQITGTVNNVDTRAQRIDLNVNSSNGYPSGSTSTVYYDSRTQFLYQNRTVSAADLRRGDQVDIRALSNNNGQYTADTVYIGSSGMASNYPSNTYPSTQASSIQGTVSYVDTTAQRIDLTSAYATGLRTTNQGNYSVYFGSQTPVYYQGKTYSPTALERGDQVDIRVFDNGSGRLMADSITVTRNVRQ